ncbi:hypothetical protein JYT15_01035 [Acidimicrobium ferrooxidans]|nr:hypothetical protein [Acidimicrobium ferrooxidans]
MRLSRQLQLVFVALSFCFLTALPAAGQRKLKAHPNDTAPDSGVSKPGKHARKIGLRVVRGTPAGQPRPPSSKPSGRTSSPPTGRETGWVPRHQASPGSGKVAALAGPGYRASFDRTGKATIEVHGIPLAYQFRELSIGQRRVRIGSSKPTQVATDRIEIARGSGITESYQSRPEGVELAFTLARPLGTGREDLIFHGQLETGLISNRTESREGFELSKIVKIGKTTVIDRSGRELLANVTLRGNRFDIHVPGKWLASASYPVVVDPLMGSNIQVSSATVDETRPECAYDPTLNRYLIVWEYKFSNNDLDVYGRFVDNLGNPIGAAFPIRNSTKNEETPVVAFSITSNRYYVAMRYQGKDIIAAILDENGLTVVSAYFVNNLFPGTKAQMPSVVWNSTLNEFGISWSDDRDGDDDLIMQVDLPTGVVVIDDTILRDSVTTLLINSQLVYYAEKGWYWISYESTVCDNFAFAFGEDLIAMKTSVVSVIVQPGADKRPRVALCNGLLMVVNESQNGSFNRIMGQYIKAATGDLIGTNFVIHEPTGLDAEDPHVAANEAMNAFIVVWHAKTADGDTDIYASEFSDGGESLSGAYTITQSPNPNANEFFATICSNSSDNTFLAFWQDGRNSSEFNIFCQKLTVNPRIVQEPPRDSIKIGHNVFAHSGEFHLQRTLMHIPGRLPASQVAHLYGGSPVDFNFTVTYRSGGRSGTDPNATVLGFNWYHSYLEWVVPGSGVVDLYRGNGRLDTFTWNGSFYQAPDGFYEKITLSGSVYTLTDRHGMTKKFALVGGLHKLTECSFRNNTISISYGANNEMDALTTSRGKVVYWSSVNVTALGFE